LFEWVNNTAKFLTASFQAMRDSLMNVPSEALPTEVESEEDDDEDEDEVIESGTGEDESAADHFDEDSEERADGEEMSLESDEDLTATQIASNDSTFDCSIPRGRVPKVAEISSDVGSVWVDGHRRSSRFQPRLGSVIVDGRRISARILSTAK
jgi:hypothetical protein